MASLDAYVDARQYLALARRHLGSARSRLAAAVATWRSDVAKERADQAVEDADARVVALYQRALYELGLAEYTGQAVNEGSDLVALDKQMDESLLGAVAAKRTQEGLFVAERELAVATVRTQMARQAVASAMLARDRAKRKVSAATAQVSLSRRDVAVATAWATVPGRAPASPIMALAGLEGPLGKSSKHHRRASAPLFGSGGLSSFTVSTGPAPGSVVPPPPPAPAATTTTAPDAPTTLAARLGAGGQAAPASTVGQGPRVLGTSLLTASQIYAWFESTGARANASVPMRQLVADYLAAGRATGVRGDIAFAQSVVETGYFSFPAYGQDPARYNNFAGIGACDKCKHGWRFPTPMAGVMSQELLLAAYATAPGQAPGGPRAPLGVEGCCSTWTELSGVWASNRQYGFEILSIYHQMLAFSLAEDLAEVGLSTVLPAGPGPVSVPATVSRPAKSEPTPSRTGRT